MSRLAGSDRVASPRATSPRAVIAEFVKRRGRRVDPLLVAETARVSVSLAGVAEFLDGLAGAGVVLCPAEGGAVVHSDAIRVIARMLIVFSRRAADGRRARTQTGLSAAAVRGRAIGQAPYGTRWVFSDAVNGPATLAAVPDEIATLRRAVILHRRFGKWNAVVHALHAEGRLSRTGKPWQRNHLARVTKNPRVREFIATTVMPPTPTCPPSHTPNGIGAQTPDGERRTI